MARGGGRRDDAEGKMAFFVGEALFLVSALTQNMASKETSEGSNHSAEFIFCCYESSAVILNTFARCGVFVCE